MSGSEPAPKELALHLGWTVDKVRLLLSVADDAVSIDAPVSDGEGSSLGDLLKSSTTRDPEQIVAAIEEEQQIDGIIDKLGERTADVIRLRFGIGTSEELTLQQIGDIKCVTRERIRQIEAKGIRQLQRKSSGLVDFWNKDRIAENPDVARSVASGVTAPVPDQKRPSGPTGVLVSLFDRLPAYARRVLTMRYGLNGGSSISEEEASAHLEMKLPWVQGVESAALGTLGHTSESFRHLLDKNDPLRESLSSKARASRRASRQRKTKLEAENAQP